MDIFPGSVFEYLSAAGDVLVCEKGLHRSLINLRHVEEGIERNAIVSFTMLFNPFPHTTILQQTTLNISCQKMENLYN